ncbi:hypothetical protein CFP59_00072 [Streptomyces malaysiensis subsp. malaysiensis]|nr:hypothetical protein CFP59_00072 [Streptomyces sp. M56]
MPRKNVSPKGATVSRVHELVTTADVIRSVRNHVNPDSKEHGRSEEENAESAKKEGHAAITACPGIALT